MIRKFRFSLGTTMLFVVTVAAAMALFVKIRQHSTVSSPPDWTVELPSLFVIAIILTATSVGSWKEHTAGQIMIQVTLACVGFLSLIWISEAQYELAIRYWCQAIFAVTVTLPLVARRYVKSALSRGPRRDWWKKMCEAVFFSFVTMLLVSAGLLIEMYVTSMASSFSAAVAPAAVPVPTPLPPVVPPPAPATASSPLGVDLG